MLKKKSDKTPLMSYKSPDYDILKIKPDSRLTGTFYDNLIKAIHSTKNPLVKRISQEVTSKYNSNVRVDMNNPITYEVVFDGDNKKTTPAFYFGIPCNQSSYLKQRFQGILPNSTLTFEDDYSGGFDNSYMFEYDYSKNSMLSLKVKENNFLQSILNLKNDIQKGEKLLFQVEMTPINDMWKSFQDENWDKVRSGKDVTEKMNPIMKTFEVIGKTSDSLLSIVDDVMEYKKPKSDDTSKKDRALNMAQYSSASKTKKNDDGFSVRVRLYVKCKSPNVARMYGVALETSLRELEEDNRLVMGRMKRRNVMRGLKVKDMIPIGRNIMSGKELASIVNLPNQKLQREFKIDSINVKQIDAPKECREGDVRIGTLQLFGETTNVYFPNDKNYLAMPKFYIAGMGGGKSNAFLNYANDVVKSHQALIDINFVDTCQLAYALKELNPNHIIADLSDENNLPSLMLPEIRILPNDTSYVKKRKAGDCASEIEYFINSITSSGTEDISTRMSQYMYCAAKIVFIYNDMKMRTVFDILDDVNIRATWIKKAVDSGVYTEDDYEIRKLKELDDDKKGTKVSGILDRYSVLMRNSTFQRMLDSDNPQFDFIDVMDNNKSISICMPEREFTNKATKDVIITYLMCRLRLAMLGRDDKDKVVHVLIDEAHHLNNSLEVISHSIAEPRKYGVAFCFCTHYFDQLGDNLKKAILNVGGHFMLLKGVGETAYNELKAKIGDEYSYEDLKEMEDWNSFNMIWIRGQHYMFVTKMVDILKDKNGKKYI